MAFTEQEKQIIVYGRANGKSQAEVEQAIARLRTGQGPVVADTPQGNSIAKDLAVGAMKGAGTVVKDTVDLVGAVAPVVALGPLAAIPQVRNAVGDVVTSIKDKALGASGLTKETLTADNTAQKVGKVGAIVGSVLGPGIARVPAVLAKKGAEGAIALAKKMPLTSPKKTVDEAVAQIAQGGTDALKPVKTALANINTQGVNTFKDLQAKLSEAIPTFAKEVDDHLATDTGIYKLADLAVKATTQGGKEVATDYVSRALTDLKSLYKAIGDEVAAGNIDEKLSQAMTNGLTRKEVNDISRTYGQEFGSKAFNKMGDPLTSTNAQAFENTRKGLKNVARQGLGGKEAQATDAKLSALYDTKALIDKNVEAVNKLKQRIQERGLVEKAGYYIAKYADIVTGGSIRGFVGGVLPRGAGYKVMNALDIEEALRKNLSIIEEALSQKTDDALVKVLRSKPQ